jgi:hypothetical protein
VKLDFLYERCLKQTHEWSVKMPIGCRPGFLPDEGDRGGWDSVELHKKNMIASFQLSEPAAFPSLNLRQAAKKVVFP